MKKIKYIVSILVIAILASCETYDDYNTEQSTIVRFSDIIQPDPPVSPPHNANLFFKDGVITMSRELGVFVSNLSDSDRTFNVTFDAELTEVNPENFTFDATVTVPANQRRGSFTFTGNDISLTSSFQKVVLVFVDDASYINEVSFTFNMKSTN